MAVRLHQVVLDADPISLGAVVAIMGEVYLVLLAVLILFVGLANVAGVPGGIIPIDDPAIAATFTA
jgi:hypothetical protein